MADARVVIGGYVRVRLTLTKDGQPWDDVADYEPTAEIRRRPKSPVLTTWDITYDPDDAHIMILTLPKEKSEILSSGQCVWDVRFVKPAGEDDPVEAFWYPSADDLNRLTLDVVQPATQEPVVDG